MIARANARAASLDLASSGGASPAGVSSDNARASKAKSCTTMGMSGRKLTVFTACLRLTAHTGSRSSATPGSPTSIGVQRSAIPNPNRTVMVSMSPSDRSHIRVVPMREPSSLGSG